MSVQDEFNRNAPPPLPQDRNAYDDRDRYAPPAPQQGGCSKGCLYGLAGCGCLTLLLAIGLGFAGWKFFNFASKAFSIDPVVVRATANEIADFNAPADLEPKMRVDMAFAKMVLYMSKDGSSQLSLVQINKKMLGNDVKKQAEIQRGIQQGMPNPQGGKAGQELQMQKTETREMKIRGKDVKVVFGEAKDSSNGKEYEVIKGDFEGKEGPVEFQLQILLEKYDEDEVVEFLEGIK